ncbi:MAG: MNIO family bufferin maturase [Candidatus Rokuibacteriota bacterium]
MDTGIGLRTPHVAEVLATRPAIAWLEVHAENYMGGGSALRDLEALRRDYPMAVHGVGLSLGSADGLDLRHLNRLRTLVERLQPRLVSEHLSWSIAGGAYLNHLLPLPYTAESLALVADHIDLTQAALRRRILIENPSSYLRFRHSTISEAEFLAELARRTGCGLLCDVNNVYVTAQNFGLDADRYLADLPPGAIDEIHLGGHSVNDADGRPILVDDHGSRVTADVWGLYARALERFGPAPTLIEWDTNIPALAVLLEEAAAAERVADKVTGEGRMSMLGELQAEMRAVLLGDPPGARATAAVLEDGLAADARLAIYGHHIVASLTDVLKATYPVVCRLVDERFFGYAADRYIRCHPPVSPCLFEYGASFADFLSTFAPGRDLAYLPDVARLEWAMNASEHANDVVPLDSRALQGLDPADTSRLRFAFDPTLTLLESPWPIDRIWRANQPDAGDATVDLAAGGARLEVRRAGDDVVFRPLGAAAWAFHRALAAGGTLEEAAAAALAREPGFDLPAALRSLLNEGTVTAFSLFPSPKETTS